LSESFETALQLHDPYRTVAVSAWPLKVLCQFGDHERLRIEVERLLSIIAREPSPVIRADAINMMLGAVVMGPKCQFWQVYDAFRQAAFTRLKNGKRNVKGESLLANRICILERFDESEARKVLNQIGPTLRSRAHEDLETKKNLDIKNIISFPNVQ
jgi:hypothetical protein